VYAFGACLWRKNGGKGGGWDGRDEQEYLLWVHYSKKACLGRTNSTLNGAMNNTIFRSYTFQNQM
jgi:hypothetical protein